MTRFILPLLCVLLATGCAGSASIESDAGKTTLTIKWRGEESPARYVREDTIPEPEPLTEADLIVALGELAGDSTLGAELVVIAKKAKRDTNRDDEDNRLNSLRMATWFGDRQRRRHTGRRSTEDNANRAFGELD